MTKLIGTNPNQVPSNADLGTAAFMDKKDFLLSKGSSLSAIDAVIPKTAVDVFIYDTSKDSDGGAWRKRTQHTSWYNERLNTTTRGSRREFPAVAVIVTESNKVTIYDGDDPLMPMWMVFSSGTSLLYTTPNSCAALNGQVFSGTTTYGLVVFNFIEDTIGRYRAGVYEGYKSPDRTIAGRSTTAVSTISAPPFNVAIVNDNVNDVAMTVLPNAPIDADTGLPVPTIAVATDGGVSVIKDDGTVVDITNSNSSFTVADKVTLNSSGRLSFINSYSLGGNGWIYVFNSLPSADNVITLNTKIGSTQNADALYDARGLSAVDDDLVLIGGQDDINAITESSVGRTEGLTLLDENTTSPSEGMVAYTTSDYATGWMNGDIKLATLSDTDDTDVTGSELVTGDNSTFTSSIGDWFDPFYGTTPTNSGGYLTFDSTGSFMQARLAIASALTVGKTYTLSFDNIAGIGVNFYTTVEGTTITVTTAGVYTMTFVATSTTLQIDFKRSATSGTCQIDNVSVRLAEEDRSVNNNGLQVFGTVTKTPVAAGADLVAYSGFNASGNYLKQPYNSDFDFGTNDFSVSAWIQLPTINSPTRGIICEREGSSGFSWQFFQYNSRIYFYVGSTSSPAYTAQILTEYDKWYHVVAGVRSGKIFIYVNGVQDLAVAGTPTSVTSTNAVMTVGVQTNTTSEPFTGGEIALLKVSGTAPSQEQIKKIYEDEKVLFQENAKATLYGSSDAVTALAYDDDTNLLHVGTSAGRSVFQGLRRVDNTTRAVGTAISAVDGFVVEE